MKTTNWGKAYSIEGVKYLCQPSGWYRFRDAMIAGLGIKENQEAEK